MSTEMIDCTVCWDKEEWEDNPFVQCQGHGCNVIVHQVCYGILILPTGPWYCQFCEMKLLRERQNICDLCPNEGGAFKKTDQYSFAHVVCALYIPECKFGSIKTMEPILTSLIPEERIKAICYICEESGSIMSAYGACMPCKAVGCKSTFHVTCAQKLALLCQENVDGFINYWGYCRQHYATKNSSGINESSVSAPTRQEEMVHEQVATSREGINLEEIEKSESKKGHLKLNSVDHKSTQSKNTDRMNLKGLVGKTVANAGLRGMKYLNPLDFMEIVTHSPVHSTKVALSDIISNGDGDTELIDKDNVNLSKSTGASPELKNRPLSPYIDASRGDQPPQLVPQKDIPILDNSSSGPPTLEACELTRDNVSEREEPREPIVRRGPRKRMAADFVSVESSDKVIAATCNVNSSESLKGDVKILNRLNANMLKRKSAKDPQTQTFAQLKQTSQMTNVAKKISKLTNEEIEAALIALIVPVPAQNTVVDNPIPGPSTSAATGSSRGHSSTSRAPPH